MLALAFPFLGLLRSDNTALKRLIEVLVSEREKTSFILDLSLSLVSCQAGKHHSAKLLFEKK